MKILQKDKVYIIILFVVSLCILSMGLYNLNELYGLYILQDEFGYWSTAATLAGKDWTGMIKEVPYYSYGYSLILTPLFWLSDNILIIYRIAIVINACMMVGCYLISFKCAGIIAPDKKKEHIALICGIISIYPAYTMNVHIAWVETLLLLCSWLLFYIVLCFLQKPSLYKLTFIIIITAYTYVVHQRTLSVVIAVSVFLILYFIVKKVPGSYWYCAILVALGCFCIQMFCKEYVLEFVWNISNNTDALVNDYAQMSKVAWKIFSVEGLWSVIKSCIMKLFYLYCASVSVLFISHIRGVQIIIDKIRTRDFNQDFFYIVFLFLNLLGALAVCAIYMSDLNEFYQRSQRVDVPIYGRYMENIMAPCLLAGMLWFDKHCYHKIVNILYPFSLGLITLLIWSVVRQRTMFILQNATGVLAYFDPSGNNKYFPWNVFVIVVFIFLISYGMIKKREVFARRSLYVICFVIWSYNGLVMQYHMHNGNLDNKEYFKASQYIDGLEEKADVYCVPDRGRPGLERMQYFLQNQQITRVRYDEVDEYMDIQENDIYIFYRDSEIYWSYLSECSIIYMNSKVVVLTKSGNSVEGEVVEEGGHLYSFNGMVNINIGEYAGDNAILQPNGSLLSNGTAGYVFYGDYITSDAKRYKIEVELESIESREQTVAVMDVNSSEGILYEQVITKEMLTNSNFYIETIIETETADFFEIRIYAPENSSIQVKSVRYIPIDETSYYVNGMLNINFDECEHDNAIMQKDGSLLSNGAAGYVLYGDYVSCTDNMYKVAIELEMIECDGEKVAVCDINSSNGVLFEQEITKEMLTGSNIYIEAVIEAGTADFFEIRVYASEKNIIQVKSVKYIPIDETLYYASRMLNLDEYEHNNAIMQKDGSLLSDGTAGYVLWGDYVTCNAEQYKVVIELEMIESEEDRIAVCDINSSDGVLFEQEITKKMLTDSNIYIDAILETETADFFEIRVYASENSIVRVKSVAYMEIKKIMVK